MFEPVTRETALLQHDGRRYVFLGCDVSSDNRLSSAREPTIHQEVNGLTREVDEIMHALNAHSIVAITDRRGIIVHVNDRFCEISQYSREELLGQTHRVVSSHRHPKEFFKGMWRAIGRGETWTGEICNRAKDGSEYWGDTIIVPLLDDRGKPSRYVAIRTEETQRHDAEEQLQKAVFVDGVTQLPNWASLVRAWESGDGERTDSGLSGLVVMSVDDVSAVSDAFGHGASNRLLVDVADRLREFAECEEGEVRLIRLNADSFGFFLPDLDENRTKAEERVARLVDAVFERIAGAEAALGDGIAVRPSITFGYAVRPETPDGEHASAEGSAIHEMLMSAEIALSHARRASGPRRVRGFRRGMLDEAQQRIRLATELRHGIGDGELRLFSQPIVDRTRRVIGVEGLVRWQSPLRGLVPPNDFIPLAEQTGLIVDLGEWVLHEACRVLQEWRIHPRARDLTFSVNLSEKQVHVENFFEQIAHVVGQHGIDPGKIRFELTESTLHTNVDRTVQLLAALRSLGIAASIDDFGTGFSSLSYLKQLPVQQLKVDRAFVSDITECASSAEVIRAIVQLGHALGLQVIAEGVETEEQFARLRELGVDGYQGFLFGRPRPTDEFLASMTNAA